MSEPKHPSEIAREALKRLAMRQLAPTPANYQACYNEIAEIPNMAPFPDGPLRELLVDLPARNEAQEKQIDRLSAAIAKRSWQGVRESLSAYAQAGESRSLTEATPIIPAGLSGEFAGKLARFVESVLPALGDEESRIVDVARELVEALKQPVVEVAFIQGLLGSLTHQAVFAAEEQLEIKNLLLKLLHLIIQNIGELSSDDSWLKGQIDGLLASVAPPLTLRHLDEMERRLRDVMEKQGRAKSRAVEAQEEMRVMLAEFVERLGTMNQSSTAFETHIEESARQIEQVSRLEDLKPLLDDVILATHAMAEETACSREQLKSLQAKVLVTESELMHLHQELDNASALARHDPLTDALNRKGLDEALEREVSSVRRKETPLSVSLLDIDNFKKLNDSFGHEAGDRALVHLADVARRNMRPCDTLARYGGEEFVVLMPDTTLEQGLEAMTRLQRELTKAIYLAGKEKILITFSAGVAQLATDESGTEAIRRADQAMYLAKRAGKNRVMGG
ncbi:MAG: GGDEF domain-containing protein [Gammaproteobacteria bacterium]|nr:GGDEF domain-containing protein [Gammaproteobacteria bacterium]MBU1602320.1 GGDEF domain-containing protein [Gammaproteobacteria bacterium]MBU2433126.1 GGDEF domain-containing protein [Gammaproteobacteria bacterium]MBU2451040.1 GGDEF domain-containing protein [Gammaproteobacteria bacterium]